MVTSENGEGFIGRESGVQTVFVHENFSGERCAAVRMKPEANCAHLCKAVLDGTNLCA